jgi:hypothetical protein
MGWARFPDSRLHRGVAAGILPGRVLMMNPRKLAAALLASLALAPVLAAGRPVCCVQTPAARVAPHACCAAKSGAAASSPRGCCKAPAVPKPDPKASDQAPLAASIPALDVGAPELAFFVVPVAVSARLARRAHRADAPEDSPPDLLSQIHVLLI